MNAPDDEEGFVIVNPQPLGDDFEIVMLDVIGEDCDILVVRKVVQQQRGKEEENRRFGPMCSTLPAATVHIFELESFVQEVWASHRTSFDMLLRQVCVDFRRLAIRVNDEPCSSIAAFVGVINALPRDKSGPCWSGQETPCTLTYRVLQQPLDMLTLLLCNQAAFGYMYQYLHQVYCGDRKTAAHLIAHAGQRPSIDLHIRKDAHGLLQHFGVTLGMKFELMHMMGLHQDEPQRAALIGASTCVWLMPAAAFGVVGWTATHSTTSIRP
jgi:hypothetical protein